MAALNVIAGAREAVETAVLAGDVGKAAAEGLCTQCGRRPRSAGSTQWCDHCLGEHRAAQYWKARQ